MPIDTQIAHIVGGTYPMCIPNMYLILYIPIHIQL